MDPQYSPAEVEQQAQAWWDEHASFRVREDPARPKFYCLSMFPYPSGRLHMGHVRNYTLGDVIARYQRMLGRNVLQPMGWDAFGLPAENAAIQHGVAPARWTRENIAYMRAQLRRLGFAYDWSREIATCDADYYRWEQWLFTRLFDKGLVYRKTAPVNWCPNDLTVLANEQVIDGCCWRCGTVVERREIPQWFMRITAYSDELLAGLEQLPGWPEQVRTMQRNWIGRSEGVEVHFGVEGAAQPLKVFTTRPDTLFGVTYVAVAPEHPLALEAAGKDSELASFVEECRRTKFAEAALETMEKRGHPLGRHAVHPLTGDPVPIFAANFVLMGYGEGAVMAVPAHDQRDYEFAQRYGLPIRVVVVPDDGTDAGALVAERAYTEPGRLVDSGEFNGLDSAAAFDAIAAKLEAADRGRRQVHYRLRDWGVSRQRYWGAPIPIIYCDSCGDVPVPADQLPVRLPEDVTLDGVSSPLARDERFWRVDCPRCGAPARRETDTFDTFVESSWYYARYACPDQAGAMLDERAAYWMPVDQYVGGIEHAILHLLYARFYNRLLRDEGLVGGDEPFTRLLTQGMVVAETYFREDGGQKKYFNPAEVSVERDDKGRVAHARLLADGLEVQIGGMEKMSKSRNNGVDPQALIERYGADTARLFIVFASSPEQSLEWSDAGVEGAYRFLRRLWTMCHDNLELLRCDGMPPPADGEAGAVRREMHTVLRQAAYDFERQQFNTVVSGAMKLANLLGRSGADVPPGLMREGMSVLLRLLAPIVPHLSHVLWRELGYGEAVLDAPFPQVDESALESATVEWVVQVNGKLRGRVSAPPDAAEALLLEQVRADPQIGRYLEGVALRKTVVVPGRLVNLVVG